MKIFILSLFPEMFAGPFSHSIIKRAVDAKFLDIEIINPRDFAFNKHDSVDDSPFGGGAGMIMRPEPVFRAVEHIKNKFHSENCRTILLSPVGRQFNQAIARELSGCDQLIFICGHYEGIDDRVRAALIDDSISIGDYVLTGGELPAMVVVDAVARLVDGVLGCSSSSEDESFSAALLEYPQYTRPREYRDQSAPQVLLNGNHAEISRWRKQQAIEVTKKHRPDLLTQSEDNDN
ncbi:MAG: tRNA (guanosine(37)-N1)-methyltransferase TrmD [Negativicutes bacterium]|jgi:tRNA (guanine37-N1)-methyltransferase